MVTAPVRQALSRGHYPWYDPARDAVRPVFPWPDWSKFWLPWLPSGGVLSALGQIWVFLIFALIATLLVAGIAWALRYYAPSDELPRPLRRRPGTASRSGELPPGLDLGLADPWAEARRRRDRGDLAGAVVALFVHQLLLLDRLRMARLLPGRTGRQLVRAVQDPWVRRRVEPTLRLFEAVYYGHRTPGVEDFEAAWGAAEEFQRRAAEGAFS
jgi:hypothetical protein